MKKLSLMEVLSGIEDTRRGRSVMYPLHEVLIIMLLAVICGATSYAKVEMFGNSKQAWLKTFLELENGIPDACTFRNVIGQLACEEKSNEITAIPKLLEMLEIKGCIVTIDAMGTQTEIAKAIRDKEGDYILALKENQKTLYNDVKLYLDDVRQEKKLLESENYYKTVEKGHGRIETRECIISEEISWLHNKSAWKDLHGIGVIYCTIEKNGVVSKQSHYFIYSCVGLNAKQIMKYKRNHWTVENNLHWVLDMAFREDESRARKDNSAENFNVIRQIAFNILKSEKTFKGGITDKQFQCLLDSSYLDTIVMNWLCS